MDKKQILKKLHFVKSFIFRNTISKIDYMKIQKETGENLPFYDIVILLNNVIKELENKDF